MSRGWRHCPVGRFLLKVSVKDDGCWQREGAVTGGGYAELWSRETHRAERAANGKRYRAEHRTTLNLKRGL